MALWVMRRHQTYAMKVVTGSSPKHIRYIVPAAFTSYCMVALSHFRYQYLLSQITDGDNWGRTY